MSTFALIPHSQWLQFTNRFIQLQNSHQSANANFSIQPLYQYARGFFVRNQFSSMYPETSDGKCGSSVCPLKHALKCKCTQTATCAAIIVPSWPPPTPQADVLSIVASRIDITHNRIHWSLGMQPRLDFLKNFCNPTFILRVLLTIRY